MQFLFGAGALLLNLIGYIPYIRDILRGMVKPHRVTWAVWTILTTIAAFNQVANGGGYSSLFFVSTAFLVTLVLILSFRYGMGGASVLDRFCLIAAIFLLIYWITVRDTYVSTILAVVIDTIGAIPTIVKVYHNPKTETYTQWCFAAIGGLLTMLAVPQFTMILVLYPFYIAIMNSLIVGVKYVRER